LPELRHVGVDALDRDRRWESPHVRCSLRTP
jgi:hypothetical protein